MSASQQEALNKLYQERFANPTCLKRVCDDPNAADALSHSLEGPFLVAVTDDYLAARPRIVIVGQETLGWIGPYAEFLSQGSVSDSVAEFVRFDFGLTKGRSVFWRKVGEIRNELFGPDASRKNMMWLNLFKFDDDRDNKAMIGSPYMDAALSLQGDIVAEEIRILDPQCVIFLTGPEYDASMKRAIPNTELRPVGDHPINEMAQVVGPTVPQLSFRTYHPNYLRYGKAAYCLPTIIEKIKSEYASRQ